MKTKLKELILHYGMKRILEGLIEYNTELVKVKHDDYLIDLMNDLQMTLNRYNARYERYPDEDDRQKSNKSK
jgi:hypothetical protein